jgi:hypothetical protein
MLTVNPSAGVKRPRILPSRHVPWSASDVRLMLAELATEPMWNALYRTALQTGMRPGELMALRGDDIAFARQSGAEIAVQRTMTPDRNRRTIVGEATKTPTPTASPSSSNATRPSPAKPTMHNPHHRSRRVIEFM